MQHFDGGHSGGVGFILGGDVGFPIGKLDGRRTYIVDVAEDAATGGMYDMIVGVDEARMDDGAFGVYCLLRMVALPQIGIGAYLQDARTCDRYRARTKDCARRVHGDHLTVADENVTRALVH